LKKILPFLVVGIFVLSGLGAVAVNDFENEKNICEKISFSKPIIKEKNEYISIDISNANSYIMKQGKPLLPSYVKTFTFPAGTKINSVTCTPSNIKQLTLSKTPMPTPEAMSAGVTKTKIEQSTISYGNDPFPDSWFSYDIGTGLFENNRCIIVKVSINPIKYYPTEEIIKFARDVEININYEKTVENNQFLEDYQLVVISPSEYMDELAPLITHKISKGITSIYVSLNDIYSGVYFPATGRDNQEKIKCFIKDTIENWDTHFILLVGSIDKLPARDTHVYVADGNDDEVFVSDLYYADIYNDTNGFCSWDSNNNNVFGEYNWGSSHNYDEVDLYPDVYLGRLACFNSNQVITCVNKIETYENNVAYTLPWFNDMVVIGGDHAEGDTHAVYEGEFVNQKVMDLMSGFIPDKVWASNGKLNGIIPNGVQEITNAINNGCGFIDFSGHGNTNVWATHPHEDESTWIPTPIGYYLNTKVQTLSNGNKLPIVIIGACSTCKYNVDPDCFGWSFLMNNNGGGIASCGASGLDWFYLGEYVAQKGFEKICIDSFQAFKDGALTFGAMWAGALNGYIYSGMDALDHKTVEEFQPFGDPSLAIMSDSQPPNKPSKPSGPINGKVGKTYTYTTSAIDTEGDQVYYLFDWGDGKTSGWIGPFNSGTTGSANHKWSKIDTFTVKTIAKDENGVIGEWSDPLSVSIPKNKIINSPLQKILEKNVNLLPILKVLFQYLGL